MSATPPISPVVLIRSAGEMASGIACRLHAAGSRRICMVDLDDPLCVRRTVSFCPALEGTPAAVESVTAVAARSAGEVFAAWRDQRIAVLRVADWAAIGSIQPDIVVDAIIAKRNVATTLADAPLVIALGPGFEAGVDCHYVIETHRGHDLGRVIASGRAAPDTGVPGDIAGYTTERVLRAPVAGVFRAKRSIGERVAKGDVVGSVEGEPVRAALDGIIRGLIRDGRTVAAGLKLGDVDPRCAASHCHTVSDKARALGGGVLEAIMRHCNRAGDRACT